MSVPIQAGVQIGKYYLEEQIGEGGVGVVFRARVEQLQRKVVIKFLSPHLSQDPRALERFRREAYIISRLNHPNLISVYDFGRFQNIYYLVMPFMDGGSLEDLLLKQGSLPVPKALQITMQIAHGVHAAHEVGVIHRDIKPANILFHQGRAVLTDFGLAYQQGFCTITALGSRIGTPLYMSPEQAKGERGIDRRTDIYSLGIVLYEMLLGVPPFDLTGTFDEVLQRIVYGKKLPLERDDVPEDLHLVLERATHPLKRERYATIEEFEKDLRKVLQGEPITAPLSKKYRFRKSVRKAIERGDDREKSVFWKGMAIGLASALAFVLLFIAFWLSSGKSQKPTPGRGGKKTTQVSSAGSVSPSSEKPPESSASGSQADSQSQEVSTEEQAASSHHSSSGATSPTDSSSGHQENSTSTSENPPPDADTSPQTTTFPSETQVVRPVSINFFHPHPNFNQKFPFVSPVPRNLHACHNYPFHWHTLGYPHWRIHPKSGIYGPSYRKSGLPFEGISILFLHSKFFNVRYRIVWKGNYWKQGLVGFAIDIRGSSLMTLALLGRKPFVPPTKKLLHRWQTHPLWKPGKVLYCYLIHWKRNAMQVLHQFWIPTPPEERFVWELKLEKDKRQRSFATFWLGGKRWGPVVQLSSPNPLWGLVRLRGAGLHCSDLRIEQIRK